MIEQSISEHSLNAFRKGMAQFVTFTEAEWATIMPYLSFRKIKKKDHFSVRGEVCSEIGFILKGSVRYYYVKDGTEITGYFSFENEFMSAYKSFLKQLPTTSFIQALEPVELIVISYKNMQLMLNDLTLGYKMERFGRLVAEHYICCYDDRITSFITQTPEERYLQLMETERSILQKIPQHYVANFLGITPVSLSRIRKRTVIASKI